MASTRATATAALGSTLALAATAAVWHSYRSSQVKTATVSKKGEKEEEQITSREIDIPEQPIKPEPIQAEEETSTTDKSSLSSNSDQDGQGLVGKTVEADNVLEKTMELTDDEEEQQEVPAQEVQVTAPPTAEDVKAAGWDADEVPAMVRVVNGAIQYTGPLGTGSRCMRAIDALPKPTFRTVTTTTVPPKKGRSKAKPVTTTKMVAQPFDQVHGQKGLTSYFEVNIVQGPTEDVEKTNQSELKPCIAVGISLHKFDWESAMLGWDAKSFGYHGDDGKAYFDKQKHECGPTFGAVGDVVGCGVDYDKKRVFYTLNGELVGYSYKLVDAELQRSWIPTVSLDSHAAVQFNGAGPFKFDITTLGKEM